MTPMLMMPLTFFVLAGAAALVWHYAAQRQAAAAAAADLWAQRPIDAIAASWQALLARLPGEVTARSVVQALHKRSGAQLVALAALGVAWIPVTLLQVVLDYQIFRALHPQSLPLAIAFGSVFAIAVTTVSLAIAYVLGHGKELQGTPSQRRAGVLALTALLCSLIGTLALLAPSRSEYEYRDQIAQKTLVVAARQQQSPELKPIAEADLAAAQAALERGKQVDQWAALVVPSVDALLGWFAITGAGLLFEQASARRAAGAGQRRQRRIQEWQAWVAEKLTRHGHSLAPLTTFIERSTGQPTDRAQLAAADEPPEPAERPEPAASDPPPPAPNPQPRPGPAPGAPPSGGPTPPTTPPSGWAGLSDEDLDDM